MEFSLLKFVSHIQKSLKAHELNIAKITKTDSRKRLAEDKKVFPRRKIKKSNNMGVSDTNVSLKMINESWLSIEKIIRNLEKTLL